MTEPCSKESEIKEIRDAIYGQGQEQGMKTHIALILQKLNTMPTPNQLRLFAFAGGGLSLFLALVGVIIFKALVGI